jgi:hypothetical protein
MIDTKSTLLIQLCPSVETKVLKPRFETEVLKSGCFFFHPFPTGCPGLIPGLFYFILFYFSPFSGGLPRVNTRVYFILFYFIFPPFSGGLPRVNTRGFFFPPFSNGLPRIVSDRHRYWEPNAATEEESHGS